MDSNWKVKCPRDSSSGHVTPARRVGSTCYIGVSLKLLGCLVYTSKEHGKQTGGDPNREAGLPECNAG